MKAGAAYLNYLHKFSALKTAADRYVNTPNNVSIDAYGNADLTTEPLGLFCLTGPDYHGPIPANMKEDHGSDQTCG
jgi:hypothetical protein